MKVQYRQAARWGMVLVLAAGLGPVEYARAVDAVATVPKTGQTATSRAGDDGACRKGVEWPSPRFTVEGNTNCVLDNLTGLIWARDANLAQGKKTWDEALDFCDKLDYGGYSDWRLPNVLELLSLIAWQYASPALANTAGTGQWTEGALFYNVLSACYWTGTSHAFHGFEAWSVFLGDGAVADAPKTYRYGVWPVRGGK